jgi:hypothetical protein
MNWGIRRVAPRIPGADAGICFIGIIWHEALMKCKRIFPRKKSPNIEKGGTDEIGCLLMDASFEAGDYKIFPNTHFDLNMKFLQKEINEDQFLYPSIETTWEWDLKTKKKINKIPNTKRIAKLHRIIPTHIIQRKDNTDLGSDFRTNDGALILKLLDVLFETTTQFHDWWWSGRVYLDKNKYYWLNPKQLGKIYFEAFSQWAKWDLKAKQVFLNCCFNFARSMTYEWDYERFTFLYICIDAIWWISQDKYGINKIVGEKTVGHSQRINVILEYFNLHENKEIVKEIVTIRNNLFHEGLWGINSPTSGMRKNQFIAMRQLHEIVQRCILRIIGIQSSFVKSNWEIFMGWKIWDL